MNNDSEHFVDGDTLVITLPPYIDLAFYTFLFKDSSFMGRAGINRVLLDCSELENVWDSGNKFKNLALHIGVSILILDPSAESTKSLLRLLPQASYIESQYNRSASSEMLSKRT